MNNMNRQIIAVQKQSQRKKVQQRKCKGSRAKIAQLLKQLKQMMTQEEIILRKPVILIFQSTRMWMELSCT